MFCNNCGHELKNGEAFCPKCGTRVMVKVDISNERHTETSGYGSAGAGYADENAGYAGRDISYAGAGAGYAGENAGYAGRDVSYGGGGIGYAGRSVSYAGAGAAGGVIPMSVPNLHAAGTRSKPISGRAKSIIQRLICLVMAVFGVLSFCFTIMGASYSGEEVKGSGFQLMGSDSGIESLFSGASATIYVIAMWVLFAVSIAGLAVVVISFVDQFMYKNILGLGSAKKTFKLTAVLSGIVTAGYTVLGIIVVTSFKNMLYGYMEEEYGSYVSSINSMVSNYIKMYTAAYVPLIIVACMAILYILVGKLMKNAGDEE